MAQACFVSVVRDFGLYNRVIVNNPHLVGVPKVAFDNREKNRPIPVRYNEFFDGYDYSTTIPQRYDSVSQFVV